MLYVFLFRINFSDFWGCLVRWGHYSYWLHNCKMSHKFRKVKCVSVGGCVYAGVAPSGRKLAKTFLVINRVR